jgi:hypothetical protein
LHAEVAGVIVGCSPGLAAASLFSPDACERIWDVAAQNPQLGEWPQRLKSAYPVCVLKRCLGDVSHAVLEKQSDDGEEEVVRLHGQRIGWPWYESRAGSGHAFLELVATQGRAADRGSEPMSKRGLS